MAECSEGLVGIDGGGALAAGVQIVDPPLVSRQLDPAQDEPETAVAATTRLMGASVATMLWVSGCTQPPPPRPEIDLSRSIAASAEDVLARTESAVASLGLSVVQVDPARGRLVAQGQDLAENTAWAQCAEPWVYDRDDGQRRRRAGLNSTSTSC